MCPPVRPSCAPACGDCTREGGSPVRVHLLIDTGKLRGRKFGFKVDNLRKEGKRSVISIFAASVLLSVGLSLSRAPCVCICVRFWVCVHFSLPHSLCLVRVCARLYWHWVDGIHIGTGWSVYIGTGWTMSPELQCHLAWIRRSA